MNTCRECGKLMANWCFDCEPRRGEEFAYAKPQFGKSYYSKGQYVYKEEKMEFKVRMNKMVDIDTSECCHVVCEQKGTIKFQISPEHNVWFCEEHGQHLKALVESQDKGQEGTLLGDLPDGTVLDLPYYINVEGCPQCKTAPVKREGEDYLVVKHDTTNIGPYIQLRCRCGHNFSEYRIGNMVGGEIKKRMCKKCRKFYTPVKRGKKYPQMPDPNYDPVPIERNSFSISKIPEAEAYYCMAHECQGKKRLATSKIYGYFGCREERFDLALCDRHGVSPVDKPVEYCQECGNVKEDC